MTEATAAKLLKNDRVKATLGASSLTGKVIGTGRSNMGNPFLYLNPDGDIHGFVVDDTWAFELLERPVKP